MQASSKDIVLELKCAHAAGRAVLVMGLGVSGRATVELFKKMGIKVVATESLSEEEFRRKAGLGKSAIEEFLSGIQVFWGVGEADIPPAIGPYSCVIVSPGVSLESALIIHSRTQNIGVFSELEMGMALFAKPSVVITGSNGKSTTVSLVHHLLQSCGSRSMLCGNIGLPLAAAFCEKLQQANPFAERADVDALVVEASSYQLEACQAMKPEVAVLLNLSENHLERHKTFEAYGDAKVKMFARQSASDISILNADDPFSKSCAERTRARIGWVGVRGGANLKQIKASDHRARVFGLAEIEYAPERRRDTVRVRWSDDRLERGKVCTEGIWNREVLVDLSGTKLIGLHNRYNLAAAILSLCANGIDLWTQAPAVELAIRGFEPLAHRLELVPSDTSSQVILNDSKATTVAATCEAIRAVSTQFPGRRLVLMVGGLAKRGSWAPLMKVLHEPGVNIKAIVFFGQDGPRVHAALLAEGLSRRIQTSDEPNLGAAVVRVRMNAEQRDIVLFSPGCASFDEFSDFEERGRAFRCFIGESESQGFEQVL